jgi:putative protease
MAFLKKIFRSLTKLFKSTPKRSRKKTARKIKSKHRSKKTITFKSRNKTVSTKKSSTKSLSSVVKDLKTNASINPSEQGKRTPANASKIKPTISAKAPKPVLIGQITHYFPRISVVVMKITGDLVRVGDTIHIKGQSTDFVQKIDSMQIESVDVKLAKRGQLVGLKVKHLAKPGDKVFKKI